MEAEIIMMPIDKITRSANRSMPDLEEFEIAKLTDAIRECGCLTPFVVSPINCSYELVVGEKRYIAAKRAGLKEVPVIIKRLSKEEIQEFDKEKLKLEFRDALNKELHRDTKYEVLGMAKERLLTVLRERIGEYRKVNFDDEFVSELRDEVLDKLSEFVNRSAGSAYDFSDVRHGMSALFCVIKYRLSSIEKNYEDAEIMLDTLLPPVPKDLNPFNFEHQLKYYMAKMKYDIYERPKYYTEEDFETSRTIDRMKRRESKLSNLITDLFTKIELDAMNVDYKASEISEEERREYKEALIKYGLNEVEGIGCLVIDAFALEKIMGPFKEFDKALGRSNEE